MPHTHMTAAGAGRIRPLCMSPPAGEAGSAGGASGGRLHAGAAAGASAEGEGWPAQHGGQAGAENWLMGGWHAGHLAGKWVPSRLGLLSSVPGWLLHALANHQQLGVLACPACRRQLPLLPRTRLSRRGGWSGCAGRQQRSGRNSWLKTCTRQPCSCGLLARQQPPGRSSRRLKRRPSASSRQPPRRPGEPEAVSRPGSAAEKFECFVTPRYLTQV